MAPSLLMTNTVSINYGRQELISHGTPVHPARFPELAWELLMPHYLLPSVPAADVGPCVVSTVTEFESCTFSDMSAPNVYVGGRVLGRNFP